MARIILRHRLTQVTAVFLLLLLALLVKAITTSTCSPQASSTNDDLVSPLVAYGTFQNPSAQTRPRFRYWVNDASHDLTVITQDVQHAGAAGAGGVELLGYYLYGETKGFEDNWGAVVQSDWTVYGWGGGTWKNLLTTVLTTAKQEGLVVDMALGPNQGAGVPARPNDTGLHWIMAGYDTTVPTAVFNDILPGWGAGALVAAVAATASESSASASTVILQHDSLIDVSARVNASGHLSYRFPSPSGGAANMVFAYYAVRDHFREAASPATVPAAVPQSPVADYTQNGSFVVDHFSAAGAQLIIDFWETHLLDDELTALIGVVGNYIWEDSMEFLTSDPWWTPALPSAFLANRGYSIGKYLPLLPRPLPSSSTTYLTDEPDAGASHIADYQQTLTELYQTYLSTLAAWSSSRLDIQFSAQVAYNLALDMLASIPSVSAPECETLDFRNALDAYRSFAGPAHLADPRGIVSNEAGANDRAYAQPFPLLTWAVCRALLAGGVNAFVLHGWPYGGAYGATTWPGFTTFAYRHAAMHGARQPAFAAGQYPDWMDWLARHQFVGQTGVMRRDLVFWVKSMQKWPGALYAGTDLVDAGYTYEALSPDNFGLPGARVEGGVFAPDAQQFRAMVLAGDAELTVDGVAKLDEFARAGLPVVFLGGLPSSFSGYVNTSAAAAARETLQRLVATLANVHVVNASASATSGGLAAALTALDILPRASVSANGTWLVNWRKDASTVFVSVFADAGSGAVLAAVPAWTEGTVTLQAKGTPYLYDAWTGGVVPVLIYSQRANSTTIPLRLAPNQVVILGLRQTDETAAGVHLEAGAGPLGEAAGMLNVTMDDAMPGNLTVLRSYDTAARLVPLSTGKSATLAPMEVPPFVLRNWTLIVESWTPPPDMFDIEAGPVRTNTTFGPLVHLVPWSAISPSLVNVSGIGYYSTSFSWPPPGAFPSAVSGVLLDLGLVAHTARLRVNGRTLPPLEMAAPRADVGGFLVDGMNEVEIVVATPLGNALREVWDVLETSGKRAAWAGDSPPDGAAYGLLVDVRVVPYRKHVLMG